MDIGRLSFDQNNKIGLFILDGAMGSLIQQKGYEIDKNLWTSNFNLNNPDIIQNIHIDYIKAGADIITTNTFRTNPLALKRADNNLNIAEVVSQSTELSATMAKKYQVLLAGSNAPAEDCYQIERTISRSDLIYNHEKHIDLLYSSGVDFILNETQSHRDEIELICNFCSKKNIPFILSLYVNNDLEILSGEKLGDIIRIIKDSDTKAILFNCINETVYYRILKEIKLDFSWGFYLNCGRGNLKDEFIKCGTDENRYAEIVKSSLNLDPVIIGACCGSNPNHIRVLKNLIDGKTNS